MSIRPRTIPAMPWRRNIHQMFDFSGSIVTSMIAAVSLMPLVAITPLLTLIEREDALPISLHVHHGPIVQGRGVERLVEMTEGRVPIVGVFALRVGVVDDEAKAHATGHRG